MKKDPASKETVDASLSLARLCLRFGRTMRATYHEDGERLESDTDHTVMLGIMATAFAAEFAPRLDRGKIAQFALIHDLAEVYAGDTPTYGIMSAEAIAEKDAREKAGTERIRKEYDAIFPWIGESMEEYERLDTPEARFVKTFDKIMAKLVHVLNDGATARKLGHTEASTREFHDHQAGKIRASYAQDQPEAMALLDAVRELVCGVDFEGARKKVE